VAHVSGQDFVVIQIVQIGKRGDWLERVVAAHFPALFREGFSPTASNASSVGARRRATHVGHVCFPLLANGFLQALQISFVIPCGGCQSSVMVIGLRP
jgi:hypothetical protein